MIRKIHLDFHTAAQTERVGEWFDAEQFAQTLTDASVNMIATPGKCNFGHTYFDTKIGRPHPHLMRPDLFPATVRACVARGIRVQAYFCLGLDDVTADLHPDWRQRTRDGKHAHWGVKHVCFATPYVDEVVIPEAIEMIERCPGICGFWFDICLYAHGALYSESFTRVACERLGAHADDELQRWLLGREIIRECCQRIDAAVRARLPDAENYFNSLVVPGEPHNISLQPVQEVENPFLFGGPEVLTATARWLRPQGRPVIGLVSRFNGPWMDYGTIRTPDQLRFDVGRVVSLGCQPSVGDHRHPNGTLDPIVYRRLAPIYAELKQCEEWLDQCKPMREVVLLSDTDRGAGQLFPAFPSSTLQAARLLEEIGLQFDVCSVEEPLPEVDLIIWPGKSPASPQLRAALESHVQRGGALLAMNAAADGCEQFLGVSRQSKTVKTDSSTIAEISPAGHVIANASNGHRNATGYFFQLLPALDPEGFAQGIPGGVCTITVSPDHQTLADLLPAASFSPACPARQSIGPAIVQRGRVIYSVADLFAVDAETSDASIGRIVQQLCDRLLNPRLVKHNAGGSVAAHLHSCPGGYVLHLLHWAIGRWSPKCNPIAEFPTLGAIEIELRISRTVCKVMLEPSGVMLPFKSLEGICSFTVPSLKVWQMIRIDCENL